MVEHDLAKVGAAGSSPVSRSQAEKKRTSRGRPFSFLSRHIRASKVRGLHCVSVGAKPRSPGPRAPSRALKQHKKGYPSGYPFFISVEAHPCLEGLMASLQNVDVFFLHNVNKMLRNCFQKWRHMVQLHCCIV